MSTKRSDEPPALAPGDVHLWLVDDERIDDADLLATYRDWLNPEETERWQRFHFAADRHRFLVARALVRNTLSRYAVALGERDWRFVANAHGRPRVDPGLPGAPTLTFNLSHTRGLVVLAVAGAGELGVDVENTARKVDPDALASRFFSPAEAAELLALPAVRRRDRFFDLWTLKEAYIKAKGLGLAMPLDTFSFSFPDANGIGFAIESPADADASAWQFSQLAAPPLHRLAVALGAGAGSLTLRCFDGTPGDGWTPAALREIRRSTVGRPAVGRGS